jgi:hypothetical protein
MKKIFYSLSSLSFLALPLISNAQGGQGGQGGRGFQADGGQLGNFFRNILQFSNDVLIPFILGIGFLVFVYGVFLYFIVGGANEDKQKQGKSLLIYATLGFVIIIIFWGVINLLAQGTGFDNEQLENIPDLPLRNN